jgi:hypothetical protein
LTWHIGCAWNRWSWRPIPRRCIRPPQHYENASAAPARNEHVSTGGDTTDRTETGQHEHQRIDLRTRCPDCGQELAHQTFNRADFQQQQLTELPNRDAMSLVNANLALPVNLALAANVLSDGSIAGAGATQNTPIDQGMLTQPTP